MFADLQKQSAVNELQAAQDDLASFAVNIREKNDLLERLTAEMDQLQSHQNHDAIDQRSVTVEQLRQSTILNDLQWETFRQTFDKAYPGYLTRLNQKLPGLSAGELRFLALSKLKLNSKEMAAILGISPGSVRMSRHRVRKKFSLEDDASFEIFIESV